MNTRAFGSDDEEVRPDSVRLGRNTDALTSWRHPTSDLVGKPMFGDSKLKGRSLRAVEVKIHLPNIHLKAPLNRSCSERKCIWHHMAMMFFSRRSGSTDPGRGDAFCA